MKLKVTQEQLKEQIKNLHRMLDVQENYIEKIESKLDVENKSNRILKKLIN